MLGTVHDTYNKPVYPFLDRSYIPRNISFNTTTKHSTHQPIQTSFQTFFQTPTSQTMSDVFDEPENAFVNLSDPEVKSLLLAWLKTVGQRHNNVCRPLVAALMSAGEALEAATVAEAAVANDTSETVDALAAAVRLAKAVDAIWLAFLSNRPPKSVIIKSIETLEDEESRTTTANRQTPTSDNDREKETNNDNDGNSNDDASSTCDETPPRPNSARSSLAASTTP